jgi:hypothetical protein
MASSVGKRQREQQKLEKARAKAERKAARQAAQGEQHEVAPRSESELIADLSALHHAFEAGDISPEEFEDRRDQLQAQFGQLS